MGQDLEAARGWWLLTCSNQGALAGSGSAHDLEVDAGRFSHDIDGTASVPAVCPHLREPFVALLRCGDDLWAAIPILGARLVNEDRDDQAEGVNDDVALAPFDLLAGVVASRPPFSVVLTDWLSTIPALGSSLRPEFLRQSAWSSS